MLVQRSARRALSRRTGRDILEGATDIAALTLASAAVRPLRLGSYEVWPPVVLAPMAGITTRAFRRLCREQGGGLYVCEMITPVALVERNPETLKMIAFGEDEQPRSLQLYRVDPDVTAKAVRIVVEQNPPASFPGQPHSGRADRTVVVEADVREIGHGPRPSAHPASGRFQRANFGWRRGRGTPWSPGAPESRCKRNSR
jgi:hypothetical protein